MTTRWRKLLFTGLYFFSAAIGSVPGVVDSTKRFFFVTFVAAAAWRVESSSGEASSEVCGAAKAADNDEPMDDADARSAESLHKRRLRSGLDATSQGSIDR